MYFEIMSFNVMKGIIESNIFIKKKKIGQTECWLPFVSLQTQVCLCPKPGVGGRVELQGALLADEKSVSDPCTGPHAVEGRRARWSRGHLRDARAPCWAVQSQRPRGGHPRTRGRLLGSCEASPDRLRTLGCWRWRPRGLPARGPRFCFSSLGRLPALGDQS